MNWHNHILELLAVGMVALGFAVVGIREVRRRKWQHPWNRQKRHQR